MLVYLVLIAAFGVAVWIAFRNLPPPNDGNAELGNYYPMS
jgi:hypothetical protein